MSAAATLPAFDALDPLALDALLDDEERLIRDTVRQYTREKFLPHVAGYWEAGRAAGDDGAGARARSVCWACTSRATAVRARRRRRTG